MLLRLSESNATIFMNGFMNGTLNDISFSSRAFRVDSSSGIGSNCKQLAWACYL